MTPEEKLKALGLTLPPLRTPIANFVPFKLDGKTIYVSGQGPAKPDGSYYIGKVGRDFTWQEAYEHAKLVGLGLLAAAKAAAGDLARVETLKLLGMVNATPDFGDPPKVINGCSDCWSRCWASAAATRAPPSAWPRYRTGCRSRSRR